MTQSSTITIERGQTLSGIAQAHGVPMSELAALNHLSPPYRIFAGGSLLIPAAGAPALEAAPVGAPVVAAAPPPPSVTPPPARAVAPQTVRSVELPPPSPAATTRPVELEPPLAAAAAPPAPAATLAPPQPAVPPPAGPTPKAAAAAAPASQANAAAAPAVAAPHEATRGGTFLWPVRGRVLEGYGAGPDGTHNDGVNIAAPRGSPVQAVDAGTVAYAGNELRGYGNLVLIKHPGGWISAYAHCDLILVKRGQKVARGQVIARVGSTGNVSTPQLHFELRRGDKPVDPRGYLVPTPRAAAVPTHSG